MEKLAGLTQDVARRLLEEKKVELVIGFEKGSLPLRSTPCFIRKVEDAPRLTWNSSCENNLANYLGKRKEKVGVIAKGCDTRSIVALIKENQIDRDKLYIVGIPCNGMIDRKKIDTVLDGRELLAAEEHEGLLILKGNGFVQTVRKEEVLHGSCVTCRTGNPVIFDELLGEKTPEKEDDYADVAAFEAKPDAERAAYFAEQMSKCIRCYACRNACPMCYCEECFVDCSTPQWIGKSASNPGDNLIFQAMRAFHTAGRCVDCGSCDRACPMGIDVRNLNRKLAKDVKEIFGAEAGMNLEDKPALNEFRLDDPQTFLMKE